MTARAPRIVRVEPFGQGGKARVHLDEGEALEVMLEALEGSRHGVGDALSPRSAEGAPRPVRSWDGRCAPSASK